MFTEFVEDFQKSSMLETIYEALESLCFQSVCVYSDEVEVNYGSQRYTFSFEAKVFETVYITVGWSGEVTYRKEDNTIYIRKTLFQAFDGKRIFQGFTWVGEYDNETKTWEAFHVYNNYL